MVVQKSTVECTSMTVRELVLGTAPEQQDIWNSLLLARLWYAHINTAASNIFGHAPSRSQERISLGSHPRVELLGDSYLQHFI